MYNMYSEESYLEAYGGKAVGKVDEISIFGVFQIKLNRKLIFPQYLVEDYIQGYQESVPDVITDEKKSEINELYEQYSETFE